MKKIYIILILVVAAVAAVFVVYARSKKVPAVNTDTDTEATPAEIHIKPAVSVAEMEQSFAPGTIQKGTQVINLDKLNFKS